MFAVHPGFGPFPLITWTQRATCRKRKRSKKIHSTAPLFFAKCICKKAWAIHLQNKYKLLQQHKMTAGVHENFETITNTFKYFYSEQIHKEFPNPCIFSERHWYPRIQSWTAELPALMLLLTIIYQCSQAYFLWQSYHSVGSTISHFPPILINLNIVLLIYYCWPPQFRVSQGTCKNSPWSLQDEGIKCRLKRYI